jgi:hypothetical protein
VAIISSKGVDSFNVLLSSVRTYRPPDGVIFEYAATNCSLVMVDRKIERVGRRHIHPFQVRIAHRKIPRLCPLRDLVAAVKPAAL